MSRSESQDLVKATAEEKQEEDPDQGVEKPQEYYPGEYHPVTAGEVLDRRYKVVRKLGCGKYSEVWLCWDCQKNVHVAVKILRGAYSTRARAMVEIEMLERVNETEDNDNEGKQRIVKLQHHFATKGPNGTHLCMVFEAEEMNLYDLLIHSKFKGIPLENVRCIIKQVLEGLSFLHEKCGIIHTDIKPENVLLCVDNNSFSETSSLGWNKPQGSATLHRKGQGKEQILATGIHYKVQDIEGKLPGNYSYSPRQTRVQNC